MSKIQNVIDAVLWSAVVAMLAIACMLCSGCTIPDKAIDGGNAKVQKNTDKSWTVTYPPCTTEKGCKP